MTTDIEFYKSLKPEKFDDFINSLKEIYNDSLKIFEELFIYSKEIFFIREFLEIEKQLKNSNKNNMDNLLIILKILSDQNMLTNNFIKDETKYIDLCNNIQSLYDFLNNNLGETEDFPKLILNIFVDEIQKTKNDYYCKKIMEIVLSNPNLISESYKLISIILKDLINNTPNSIVDNIEIIKKNVNVNLESISFSDNDTLNEIILSNFENQLNLYFESIPQLSDDELVEYFPKYYCIC